MTPRSSKNGVVGVRELKTRLGRYLREVRKGRTIVITDRGEPVAELRPVSLSGAGSAGALDRLVALGLLTRSVKGPLARFRPIRVTGRPVSDTIVEDREDRI
jgi:prevent-host-death family protein